MMGKYKMNEENLQELQELIDECDLQLVGAACCGWNWCGGGSID